MERSMAFILSLLFVLAPLSGCFGEEEASEIKAMLTVDENMPTTAVRGQYLTLNLESTVAWTISRSPGVFFQDEFGVLRDGMEMSFPASTTSITVLVLDSERDSVSFNISAGDQTWNTTLPLEDSTELMLVDGRRAYDTIDMLTSQYNNRWCASA
jgi:hypothetical protein